MDDKRWQRLQALFEEAVSLPPEAREGWLAALEGEDADLIDELRRLLAVDEAEADRRIGGRIERFATTTRPADELSPGTQVGRYTIDGLLGHGGMGRVYRAHRSDQAYEQKVVIKVVQAGPGEHLVRLFERERQILADLNHPNIARLLDGGTLEDGPPYLVMEYVDGTDLVSYCEARRAGLTARLELFLEVCEAVQYAHANLVVHRDIKPANVLVDDHGRARLLDFGVATLLTGPVDGAKAADPLTRSSGDRTLSSALLSPAYASPEQLRGEPVTTASDIYSLGLLLYRLVVGRLPRPDESDDGRPPAPSRLLRESGRTRLARLTAGDLDAVILRALEQDPDRRHTTADEFGAELERFLQHRPVHSRGAGAANRLRLFVRRNPGLSGVIGASALLAAGFTAGMAWLVVQLGNERDQALAARATTDHVAGFMVDLFAAADPGEHQGNPPDVRELLDRGAARIDELDGPPDLEAELKQRMAEAYRHIGANARADHLLDQALATRGLAEEVRTELLLEQADLWRDTGRLEAAGGQLRNLIERLERERSDASALASAYNNYGLVLERLGRAAEAERWIRRALTLDLPDDRDGRIDRLAFRNNLALVLANQARHEEAIEQLRGVIDDKLDVFGERHPSVLLSRQNLADAYRRLGRIDEAANLLIELRRTQVAIHGEMSLAVAEVDNELANAFHDAARYPEAERHYRRAFSFLEAEPQADPGLHAFVANNLASLLEDRGDLDAAGRYFDRSVALRSALFAPDSLPYLHGLMNRIRVLIRLGRLDEAAGDLDRVERTLARHHPDQAGRHEQARLLRAEWLLAAGEPDHAAALLPELATHWLQGDATGLGSIRRALRLAAIAGAIGDAELEAALLSEAQRRLAGQVDREHPIHQQLRESLQRRPAPID